MPFDFLNTITPAGAPSLSAATDVFVSSTSGAGTVTTDTGSGTLYYVLSSSATAPSAAQIKAGNDHTGAAAVASGSQAVSTTGSQATASITGLTEDTTYYLHFVHNAAVGDSNVASGDGFTTPMAGSWTETAGATISTVTMGTITAPAPVWFEATSLTGFDTSSGSPYDPQAIDIEFIWTVQGAPLSAFSAPQNMVTGWNDPNTMYGKQVSFCFPQAGSYTVELRAYERSSGKSTALTGGGVISTTVVVAAPSYSSGNTVVFSSDGDFTGAPAGTQISSLSALNSEIASRTSAGFRLSIKPNVTHPDFRCYISGNGLLEYVDTWTAGEKATLEMDFQGFGADVAGFEWEIGGTTSTGQITFRDLKFISNWDPQTETGYGAATAFEKIASITNRVDVMIYGCEFAGLSFVNVVTRDFGGVDECRLMMADNIVRDWRGYGIGSFPLADSRAWYSFLGNRVAMDPLALHGGDKESGLQIDHGGIRITNAQRLHIAQNDIFTFTGWSGTPTDANGAIRAHSSVEPNSGSVAERNVIEGGKFAFEWDGQNTGQPELGGTHLIARNLHIGTAKTNGIGRLHFGGTILRNNICVFPDVPMFKGITEFYDANPENPQASNQQPFGFYNNSFVSLETDGARPLSLSATSYWNTFINDNNIHYRLGGTSDGPLDTSTAIPGITPRFAQVRYNYELYFTASAPSVANGATWSIPYSAFPITTGFATTGLLSSGSGAATNQAYWLEAEAAGDDMHAMKNGGTLYYAWKGHFSVEYQASNVVITNTSGGTWGGGNVYLRLDRKSKLDTDLPAATAYANPSTIPNLRPTTDAGAIGVATSGKIALFDIYGDEFGTRNDAGAVEA